MYLTFSTHYTLISLLAELLQLIFIYSNDINVMSMTC